MLRDSTSAGTSLEKVYFDSVQVNGKDLAANFADGNYKVFDIGDPRADTFSTTVASAVQQITAFAPNFILVGGTAGGLSSGGTATGVQLVEKSWGAGPRPYWIANDTILFDPVINQVKADPTLRKRLAMVAFGPNDSDRLYARYNIAYDAVFGADLEATRTVLSAAAYDATYMTFYAVASLNAEPVTPVALGKAFRNVADPNGTPIDVGSDKINDAFTAFSRGQKVKFNGTWGTPVFNSVGANLAGNAPIYCIEPLSTPAISTSGIFFDSAGNLVLPTTSKCEF